MDRNSIIGIVLIAAILIVWSVVFSPNKKEMEERKRQQDSLALVLQQQEELKQKEHGRFRYDRLPPLTLQTRKVYVQYGEFAASATGEKKTS